MIHQDNPLDYLSLKLSKIRSAGSSSSSFDYDYNGYKLKKGSHRFSPFSFLAQEATCPANTAWRNRTVAFGWSVIGRTRMDFTPWCTLPGKTSTRPASPAPAKASREFTITKTRRNRNNTSKITSPLTRPRTDIDRSPIDRSAIVSLPGYKHLIVSPLSLLSIPKASVIAYTATGNCGQERFYTVNIEYAFSINCNERGKYFDTHFSSSAF